MDDTSALDRSRLAKYYENEFGWDVAESHYRVNECIDRFLTMKKIDEDFEDMVIVSLSQIVDFLVTIDVVPH